MAADAAGFCIFACGAASAIILDSVRRHRRARRRQWLLHQSLTLGSSCRFMMDRREQSRQFQRQPFKSSGNRPAMNGSLDRCAYMLRTTSGARGGDGHDDCGGGDGASGATDDDDGGAANALPRAELVLPDPPCGAGIARQGDSASGRARAGAASASNAPTAAASQNFSERTTKSPWGWVPRLRRIVCCNAVRTDAWRRPQWVLNERAMNMNGSAVATRPPLPRPPTGATAGLRTFSAERSQSRIELHQGTCEEIERGKLTGPPVTVHARCDRPGARWLGSHVNAAVQMPWVLWAGHQCGTCWAPICWYTSTRRSGCGDVPTCP